MNKLSKIFLLVWIVLALVSFISSFWAPLYFKIIGLTFGTVNILTILTWVISYFVLKGQQSALEKMIEESNEELEKELEDGV